MRARKVRRRLRDARDEQRAVRVQRLVGSDLSEGFVLAANRRWVLIRELNDLVPWCWTVIRTTDIRRVTRSGSRRVVERSQQTAGAWPPAVPPHAVDLAGTVRAVLTSARRSAPLVTFHTEHLDAGVCYVGRPVRWRRRHFEWQDVSPAGRWGSKTRWFRLDDVTKVEFGTPYALALNRLAGDPPAPR